MKEVRFEDELYLITGETQESGFTDGTGLISVDGLDKNEEEVYIIWHLKIEEIFLGDENTLNKMSEREPDDVVYK